LAEDQAPDTVQIFRTGTWQHPDYGTFEFTPAVFSEMVENFRSDVRGVDLAIDYEHDDKGPAAAWIKDVFLKENGEQFWARVQWTPNGKTKVENKDFRYLSGDCGFKYQDPETLQWHGATLFGAALTNRPFLKRMAPVIRLSEITDVEHEEEDDMTLEEAKSKITELEGKVAKLSEGETMLASLQKALGDQTPEDLSARIKELEGQVESQTAQLSELRRKNTEAQALAATAKKEAEFNVLLSEGKVVPAQKEAFLKGDTAELLKLSQPLNLRAKGSGEPPTDDLDENAAQQEILKQANLLLSEGKVSDLGAGVRRILSEKKELAQKYYTATGTAAVA
jgi:phage I-like protein